MRDRSNLYVGLVLGIVFLTTFVLFNLMGA